MKSYTVYFDVFGHKMKTKVVANDHEMAKRIVKDRITFIKFFENKKESEEAIDMLNDMLKGFKM